MISLRGNPTYVGKYLLNPIRAQISDTCKLQTFQRYAYTDGKYLYLWNQHETPPLLSCRVVQRSIGSIKHSYLHYVCAKTFMINPRTTAWSHLQYIGLVGITINLKCCRSPSLRSYSTMPCRRNIRSILNCSSCPV